MPVSLDYAEYDLGGLTSAAAGEAIAEADFVVLPTGSIEQHAEHLPVSVDTLRAESLTRELVEAAPDHDLSMVRLPTLPYGYSEHHMFAPGTVTLDADTYRRVLTEIMTSVAEHGAERIAVVNCHGGNIAPLKLAADRVQRDTGVAVFPINWTDFARERLEERFGDEWSHAGEHETSVIELFHPDLVDSEAKTPQDHDRYEVRQYAYFDEITPGGGTGDPTASDPEFVEEVIAEATVDIIEALERDLARERGDREGAV
jgi:creatinine amidohydrolase